MWTKRRLNDLKFY
ncbi:rCG49941 [Rattus norvegicus]|uniref:RCG49941 n=1 Tax=Rattus norvegicus TaxID=10116 RepID=A6MGU8_RAT|nr:rCG49941 [Rattus norvegicus]